MGHLPRGAALQGVKLFVNPRLNVAGLNRQLQDYYRNLRSAEPRIRRANQANLQWLSRVAQQQLEQRIAATGRRQSEPQNLVRIVGDPAEHSVATGSGFAFWIPSKVDRTPVSRYWRGVEQGSRAFLGRRIMFRNGFAPGANRLARTGEVRFIRSRGEENERGALIRRPIPAYHYLQTAVTRFEAEGIMKRHLREAFVGTPIRFD